ncbi:MAG: ABC transporter substrate-binding protein [Devosia sp.]|uniref:ABC transporter substrate-binding protein n=1 Tax=Devosia sp. TaxID=1871048 RepID=UPI0024C8CD4E|nr:ABC transporter substrate-binding protein [Devosia sp.]UYN99135.1 MAG: ABC transporter substrate-binding protein [Devosia sp.]
MSHPILSRRLFIASGLAALAVAGPVRAQGDAPIPEQVPPGTRLVIGDPQTQFALQLSGLIDELSFDVEWANISGGPQTSEAFRARALDLGSVAEIPGIFANWNNLPVRFVAYREKTDPIGHPIYVFGIAPGARGVASLKDFAGKRIAFSPGQAQGALVLRALKAAGLTTADVTLVELPSTGDVYPVALASNQVDIAPLGGTSTPRYLTQYGKDGATVISHGLRDDPGHLYAPQWVLDDPAKAAAIREYVGLWARARQWVDENPQLWIDEYLIRDQGLSREDAEYLSEATGTYAVPGSWDEVKTRHQATIDLLAAELGYQPYDVELLFDNRFETVAADALAAGS